MSKKVIQTIEEYCDGRGYKVIDSKRLIECKDCKHWDSEGTSCPFQGDWYVPQDGYCFRAKRKEEWN